MRRETDPSWMLLCSETILPQLEALMREGEAARVMGDIENVHRMRVASRRLRAALRVFEGCFPPKRFKAWRSRVRDITRSLGEARDADVQIEFLEGFLADLDGPGSSGVGMVLEMKRARRRELQADLAQTLDGLESDASVTEMRSAVELGRQKAWDAGARGVGSAFTFEKAAQEVRARIEELAGLEACVRREEAVAEHHSMRIAGKRLRYALEIFSPLFEDRLKDELAAMKRLQDLLGEMHDCDVWASDLKEMLEGSRRGKLAVLGSFRPQEVEPGLRLLSEDRRQQRGRLYREFVLHWEDLSRRGFLDSLQRRMEGAAGDMPDLTSKAIEALLADPGIKVALLGDVHGNAHALRAVLRDAEARGARIVVNTGDFLGYGADPEEVVRSLRAKPSINIIGNYDLKVFRVHERGRGEGGDPDKALAFEWAYDHISPSSREWLASLPREVRLEIGGRKVLLVHGSPDSMDEHIGPGTPERRLREIASSSKADLILFGHSHQAMSRKVEGTRFLNPGSVGRQDDGDPRASYALLRIKPFMARIHRVEYDAEQAAARMRLEGLPESFAQMILQGRSYDRIVGMGRKGALTGEEALERVRRISCSYLGGDPHSEQVARLAGDLFDCLAEEMGLVQADRSLLIAASLLHDVGWVEGRKGHHKASQRIILEEEGLPFERRERAMVSCIARYHRKALPDKKHAHYSSLAKKDRRRVARLSALLRTADALDCTHGSLVRSLRCELLPGKIVIRCSATADLCAEEAEARKKGDLLEKVLGRELEVLGDVS